MAESTSAFQELLLELANHVGDLALRLSDPKLGSGYPLIKQAASIIGNLEEEVARLEKELTEYRET